MTDYIHTAQDQIFQLMEMIESKDKELTSLRSELAEKEKRIFELQQMLKRKVLLCEAADKVIEAYRSQIYNGTDGKKHLKAIEVYDQLKNTKP